MVKEHKSTYTENTTFLAHFYFIYEKGAIVHFPLDISPNDDECASKYLFILLQMKFNTSRPYKKSAPSLSPKKLFNIF